MEIMVRIQQSADRLFRKFGIRSVTMDDVAKEVAISKKTIYSCFRDKNDLVSTIIGSHIKQNEETINKIIDSEANPIQRFASIAAFIIETYDDMNPSMINDLRKFHPETFDKINEFRDSKVIQHAMKSINDGRKMGFFRDDFHEEIIARAFSSLTFFVFERPNFSDQNISKEELVVEIIKYHLRSICNENGLKELEKVNWPKKADNLSPKK